MLDDPGKICELIKTTEDAEFGELRTRMDEDMEIWDLNPNPSSITAYEASVQAKTKVFPTQLKIISNDLRTFADKTQSILAASDMQIFVRMAEEEGEDKRAEMGQLERLFLYALEMGDVRLRRLLLPPLRESVIWHSLVRGWAAGRFLVYSSNKKDVVFDFMPLDPRWLVYEIGSEGLLWVAYTVFRSREALKNEYNYDASGKTNIPVIDFWENDDGKIYNSTLSEGSFLQTPELYDVPSMPILIMPVSTRPPVSGTVGTSALALKGYGESIFAPTRGINAVRNRFSSMVASHGNLLANQPVINYYDEEGKQLETTTWIAEGVTNLPMGHNRLEASPMKEIAPTVISFLGWLNGQMEQGTLPRIPIDRPPPSGTLYNLAQEAGNKIFNPQLRNLSYFYADICRLIEEQLLSHKLKVKVKGMQGREYYETQVTPVDLKRPHTIKVEFTARTPWTQMDTYQVADMAKRLGLPESFVWEYILKIADPTGLGDQRAVEVFEMSPVGLRLRAIRQLMKTGRDDEANELKRQIAFENMAKQQEMMGPEMRQGGMRPEQGQTLPEREALAPEPEMMPPGGGL